MEERAKKQLVAKLKRYITTKKIYKDFKDYITH